MTDVDVIEAGIFGDTCFMIGFMRHMTTEELIFKPYDMQLNDPYFPEDDDTIDTWLLARESPILNILVGMPKYILLVSPQLEIPPY